MPAVRVRFPPSPTGYLHIGGARTALYNWLFARQHKGQLVLRIEDTDADRSTDASTREILDGLQWMGIDWDEGPYLQTEYADEHRATAQQLLDAGRAYRCFCTPEELSQKREAARAAKQNFGYDGTCRELSPDRRAEFELAGRPFVVRFRVPEDDALLYFDDLVFGRSEFHPREIDDFVVVRSNGAPLYVLSNVVDDHRDRISHVIRGADHLVNTPKQILLYRALDWPVPTFGHIALTLDQQKAKISKRRHGEVVAVSFYKSAGFLPDAFCNFIALLGWSPGDDREFFPTRGSLLEAFDLRRVKRANSVFNYRKGDPKFITDPKAIHINGQHIRSMPVADLAAYVQEHLNAAGLWDDRWAPEGRLRQWFLDTLELIRVRYHFVSDFSSFGRAFFSDTFEYDEKGLNKTLRKDPRLSSYLPLLADRLQALKIFDLQTTEATLRKFADELEVKAGVLINAARMAITGQPVGPGIFEAMCAVGKQRAAARLRRAADVAQGADVKE